ncbi:unnamed protein product [Dibothriocephalus latus]|uniref:Vacuolar protein sorting-associated protein 54 C-terminal domain-containing protein n=1 Tax=Dibothriocephalus latus TaxID=60516 RepID=A0A3P7MVQ1_DIBLA|nr:unnamed protein product [Dibothriocephalus latus]
MKSVPQEIGEDLIRKLIRVYWDAVSWCQTRIITLVSPRARTGGTKMTINNGARAPSDPANETNGEVEVNERLTAAEFIEVAELLDSFQQVVQDAWCFFTAPLAINSHSTDQSAIAVDSTAITTTVVVNLPPQAMRLHGVIANFASGLLHSFHLDRCTKLRLMLDHENWQAAAVPAPVQSLVDVLHQRKVFNSRSCELVLGAGARDLSVLTTISARNLALVCRSLEVIIALLPCLAVFFEK